MICLNNYQKNICNIIYSILNNNIIETKFDCNDGFIKMNDLFEKKIIENINIEEFKFLVLNDEKKRFVLTIKNNSYYIKTINSYFLNVDDFDYTVLLKVIIEPCTYCAYLVKKEYIESICTNGISKVLQKYIVLINEEKQLVEHMNIYNKLIIIDMERCMIDGIKFFKYFNGEILTNGNNGVISTKYFLDITDV